MNGLPVQGHLPFDGIESGRACPPPQRAINKRVEVIAIEPRIGKLFIQHFDQQEAKYGQANGSRAEGWSQRLFGR